MWDEILSQIQIWFDLDMSYLKDGSGGSVDPGSLARQLAAYWFVNMLALLPALVCEGAPQVAVLWRNWRLGRRGGRLLDAAHWRRQGFRHWSPWATILTGWVVVNLMVSMLVSFPLSPEWVARGRVAENESVVKFLCTVGLLGSLIVGICYGAALAEAVLIRRLWTQLRLLALVAAFPSAWLASGRWYQWAALLQDVIEQAIALQTS